MEKQHIHAIINHFFENKFSKEVNLKFQYWLTHKSDMELKNEVLNELWENEQLTSYQHAFRGLEEMNKRIGKKRPTMRITLRQRMLRIAAIFVLPVIGALMTYWMNNHLPAQTYTDDLTEYIVPDGEIKQLTLPDGSQVWLNAGSVLVYTRNLSGSTRKLFLNGEAIFQVQHDPERPFIVNTQYMQVEALGTTFIVKSYNDNDLSEVVLEEGSIKVDIIGKITASEIIQPDEQIIYNHRNATISKCNADAAMVTKWREGYLVFNNSTFEDIIHTIERRFKVSVEYNIRKYGGGSFNIKYTPYENVEQILTILATLNPGMKWTKTDNMINIK